MTQAIELAKKYGTRLYICHVSTAEELEIIKQAKKQGVKIYAEATPHHLFLNESAYEKLGTLAQMNPPLRSPTDCAALWQGIGDGTIDTIGSDHAPHTLEEKSELYPASPSGVPGIETTLPLLLTAHRAGKITLEKIIELTRGNPQKIFNLPKNNDQIIVDINMEKEVKNANLKTKCGWSPFAGWKLVGWPIAVIINNKTFKM
ncbi:MAG: Dihydroorotase [Candidatus Magasanikbacteria bacterium GW2011_GWA2_41_55]|uniref:Dihydroorotase n=1 Tax=Candidatus Magasanikbacteria bacterium GW2011_GWA2_41_55 TaxID=1619038 RepID=A0A0G0WM39_9BACT|nr:MAG: Dihydroorotase [Candidatus Magasanikbacteria bacterium GW2011_GWA2_41_55]